MLPLAYFPSGGNIAKNKKHQAIPSLHGYAAVERDDCLRVQSCLAGKRRMEGEEKAIAEESGAYAVDDAGQEEAKKGRR